MEDNVLKVLKMMEKEFVFILQSLVLLISMMMVLELVVLWLMELVLIIILMMVLDKNVFWTVQWNKKITVKDFVLVSINLVLQATLVMIQQLLTIVMLVVNSIKMMVLELVSLYSQIVLPDIKTMEKQFVSY